ncbi:N-acetyl-gamma-glutamyl-phosphate reductase [Alienimonas californiensis]|uniref:N-acetyl-gamma-glutamyl-phosphate reductase n=1 Tax=Alienimonas californiensis TaxID=2527989 RepID=A0A517PF80_9PLAN|nr:N-acetyl-gamma-glutamyl-phosphate reductase [Alienimonas californiensis]QDT18026.1 N-acetyl-gamma-glutamyl-phosphate reductase [Alienimonas californiensis]
MSNDRTTVAVHGATGYAARELLTILLRHPGAEIVALTTRRDDAPHVADVHPALRGRLDLRCENLSPAELAERAEVVFLCTPHGASMAVVPELLAAGAKVIDLSADYRLNDPAVYAEWYKLEHTDAARLPDTVYGLPELFRDVIPAASLVANPGCYTSASILALAPLLAGGWIEPSGIIVDAKSGASGAGRNPKLGTLFSEVNESLAAYAVGDHRHQPEIEQALAGVAGAAVDVLFTPHLVPMDRGILATIYATPANLAGTERLLDVMRAFYADSPFVRVLDGLPGTKATTGTNFCDLTVRTAKGRVVVLAALDNLVKGAAGVAVQNFNLITGRPETTGFPEAGG